MKTKCFWNTALWRGREYTEQNLKGAYNFYYASLPPVSLKKKKSNLDVDFFDVCDFLNPCGLGLE